MSTEVSAQIQRLSDSWDTDCGYPSAVPSGILPDAAHIKRGGYHCSVNDLYANGNGSDYSNTRPDDKDQNRPYGAAIDMSMALGDMAKCHSRVYAIWEDRSDPRRVYLNAVNCYDGKSTSAVRLDFYANTSKPASADHKWHNHLEVRRKYLLSDVAVDAILSILRGESREDWETSMAWSDADITAIKARVDCLIDDEDVNPFGDSLKPEPNKMKARQVAEHAEVMTKLGELDVKLDAILLALRSGGQPVGGSGLTEEQTRTLFVDVLNKTSLSGSVSGSVSGSTTGKLAAS